MGDAQVTEPGESFTDELPAGTELLHGQYTIEAFLNAGGFGITYRARDSLDRKVVIKECFPGAFCRRSRVIVQARSRAHTTELQSIVRLFVQEARSLSKLQHPNIVGVHQVFEENDTAYMALDFVEGQDLQEILEDPDQELAPAKIASILRDILGAIGFVHAQDMLHRDISPDNILLDADMRPVLIDFGAARQQATKQSRVLSALRVVKDGYSPQEFYIAGSEQGPYSDLYALGASFYHVVTGDVPPNSQARLTAIATGEADPYVPLVGRMEGYDEAFLAALDKALSVLPKDRLQSAADWLAMMAGEALPSAAPLAAKSKPKAKTPANSNKMPLFAGVAAVALIAAGIGLTQSGLLSGDDSDTDVAAAQTATPEAPVELVYTGRPAPQTFDVDTRGLRSAWLGLAIEEAALREAARLMPNIYADVSGPARAWDSLAEQDRARRIASGEWLRSDIEVQTIGLVAAWEDLSLMDTDRRAREAARLRGDIAVDQRGLINAWRHLAKLDAARIEALRPKPLDTPAIATVAPETPLTFTAANASRSVGSWSSPRLWADDAITLPGVDMQPVEAVAFGAEIIPPTPRPQLASLPEATIDGGTGVLSGWAAALPFEDLRADADGRSKIVAVEGWPVNSVADFNKALRASLEPGVDGTVAVNVGLSVDDGATATPQTITLPVVQDTVLLNGMQFRTRLEEGTWVTRVTAMGPGVATDLQVGDTLMAFAPTNEALTTRTAMSSLMEREAAAGRSDYSFLVMRDGSNWMTFMTFETPLDG